MFSGTRTRWVGEGAGRSSNTNRIAHTKRLR